MLELVLKPTPESFKTSFAGKTIIYRSQRAADFFDSALSASLLIGLQSQLMHGGRIAHTRLGHALLTPRLYLRFSSLLPALLGWRLSHLDSLRLCLALCLVFSRHHGIPLDRLDFFAIDDLSHGVVVGGMGDPAQQLR